MPPSRGRLGCWAVAASLGLTVAVLLLALTAKDPPLAGRLVSENNVVEWLQVALVGYAAAVALRQGRAARRTGQPAVLEVAIVAAMVMICIGEVDLDRLLFGIKIISTRFFTNPAYSLASRLAAVTVIVGGPFAVGVYLLVHLRRLWEAGLKGLCEPWGQVAAFGMALFVAVEAVERPLNRVPWLPPHFAEEVLELVSAIFIVVGLRARTPVATQRTPPRPRPERRAATDPDEA